MGDNQEPSHHDQKIDQPYIIFNISQEEANDKTLRGRVDYSSSTLILTMISLPYEEDAPFFDITLAVKATEIKACRLLFFREVTHSKTFDRGKQNYRLL